MEPEEKKTWRTSYLETYYCGWCYIDNFGITHFGLHTILVPHSSIRFDIFHLRQAVTKKQIEHLRRFMRGQPIEVIDKFDEILEIMWRNFCVSIWTCNKAFSSFQGKDIKVFIKSIPEIVDFIETNFSEAEHLIHLAKVMKVWKNIQEFIHKITVNEAMYMEELSKFRSDTKGFYKYGAEIFLTKTTKGDQETFYTHTLRYYLPYIEEKKFIDIS